MSDDASQPLLRPVRLGALDLPNRVVMAPMTRARATNPGLVPTDQHAVYYTQRASAGLIVTEGTWVGPEAIGYIHVPGIYTDEQTAGWARVTDAVHARAADGQVGVAHPGGGEADAHLAGSGVGQVDAGDLQRGAYGGQNGGSYGHEGFDSPRTGGTWSGGTRSGRGGRVPGPRPTACNRRTAPAG
ncbi:NADPH dehydrogenase [Streptomyces griseoloalbus]